MITIYITIVLGIVTGVIITRKLRLQTLINYILNGIIGGLIGFALGIFISLFIPREVKMQSEFFDIENINDNNSVNGRFFLGCGNIDGSMKYVFYYKTEEGFKMSQVDYEIATIKYSEGNPKVERIINYTDNNFAIELDDERYIFYVPKGTIKQNYNLDAQ